MLNPNYLILTNDKEKVLTSGVVDTQLSDHSLVYTILRSSAPRTRSRKICFRSLKNFSRENFVHDMQIVPFHIIDLFDELDDKLYAFEQLFLSVLSEHSPIKQTMVRGNQVPYMTEQYGGGRSGIATNCGKNSRAIVLMQITRHTKLNVVPAPLLGQKP